MSTAISSDVRPNVQPFLHGLAENFRSAKVPFIDGSKMSSIREADFLFFRVGGKDDVRQRPVAICVCHGRNSETLDCIGRFFERPARTAFGEALRVALIIDDATDIAEVADGIRELLTLADGEIGKSLRWTMSHQPGVGWTERVEEDKCERSEEYLPTLPEVRSARAAQPKPAVSYGIVFEDAIVEALRSFGFTVTRDAYLDQIAKTDFVLTSCEGIRRFRKLAVQVTQRRDDYLKLRDYNRIARQDSSGGADASQRLYVQYAAHLTPREVAAAIFGHAVSAVARTPTIHAHYIEIDDDGARPFSILAKLRDMRFLSNPDATAHLRLTGQIIDVRGGFIGLAAIVDGRRELFAAHLGNVAHQGLKYLLKQILDSDSSPIGTQVSFIPDKPRPGKGKRRTAKMILPVPSEKSFPQRDVA